MRCSLTWGTLSSECNAMAAVVHSLERKRRVFMHSPTTFWKLASQPLNRSLVEVDAWEAPFSVDSVFLPAPRTCACSADEQTPISCWQEQAYMHCRYVLHPSSPHTIALSGASAQFVSADAHSCPESPCCRLESCGDVQAIID